jgi:hypothetical protein
VNRGAAFDALYVLCLLVSSADDPTRWRTETPWTGRDVLAEMPPHSLVNP